MGYFNSKYNKRKVNLKIKKIRRGIALKIYDENEIEVDYITQERQNNVRKNRAKQRNYNSAF